MAGDLSENSRRIARNTALLYFRMFLTMLVSLYTSRVVLNALGVEDYGIYNVVGGVVAMFGFLNAAMSTATQRYITFALGRGDSDRLAAVFNTSVRIHFLIALIILVLAETAGLWFLHSEMTIPPERTGAAFWVYQCSVLSTIVLVMSVPYNASIIAHERMDAFAYISIFEVSFKLGVALLLVVWPSDKLVVYAVLLAVVQIVVRIVYGTYCRKHFSEARYTGIWDRGLFREMVSFAGWNLWGNCASIFMTQGLNVLLNVFFTPAVNAARAVAVQVQSVVMQFSQNFQMAINPQITKSYAADNMGYLHSLVFRSSKFSFILLYMVSLPIMLEAEVILEVWLKTVPQYTPVFLRIILVSSIIDSAAGPLMVVAQATGKVKVYQSVVGGVLLTILPVSYVVLRLGGAPYSVFLVHLVICIVAFVLRLVIVKPMIGLSVGRYFREVAGRCLAVVAVSLVLPLALYFGLDGPSWLDFVLVCLASVLSVAVASYFIALDRPERAFVVSRVVAFKDRFVR